MQALWGVAPGRRILSSWAVVRLARLRRVLEAAAATAVAGRFLSRRGVKAARAY